MREHTTIVMNEEKMVSVLNLFYRSPMVISTKNIISQGSRGGGGGSNIFQGGVGVPKFCIFSTGLASYLKLVPKFKDYVLMIKTNLLDFRIFD